MPRRQQRRRHALGQHALADERHAEIVHARGGREAHLQRVVRGQVIGGRAVDAAPRAVRRIGIVVALAADREARDERSVEEHVDLFARADGADPRVREVPAEPDLHQVLAVQRKIVADERAAARAVRQALVHAGVLPEPARQVEGLHRRPDGRIAHGELADAARREHVAAEQRRRHRQHLGDVVEALVRLVGRQQLLGVDLQRQQVADGVAVLEAVQAVIGDAARIRVGGGVAVELGLQPGNERVELRRLGTAASRGRHRAAAQLADHLLPDLGARADAGHVGRVEQQVGGPQPIVVAGDAVAVEEGARIGRGR